MALTFSELSAPVPVGEDKEIRGRVNIGVYATSGLAVDHHKIGLSLLKNFEIIESEGGLEYAFDEANQKLICYQGGTTHSHPVGTLAAGNESTHAHPITAQNTTNVSGGTPAGTNGASVANGLLASCDNNALTLPAWALTHAADPTDGGNNRTLHAVVMPGWLGGMARFESNQVATADTTFSSQNNGSYYNDAAQRAYAWVEHNATPTGVQIFIDEADGDKLKADFTGAGVAGHKHVALRMSAGTIFLKVLDAPTAGMKALYYDDNGLDNAKLIYLDAGGVGGTVHNDNRVLGGHASTTVVTSVQIGYADAQIFTGTPLGGHAHATTGTTAAGAPHTHALSGSTASTAGAAATEVPNLTDLSAITASFVAIGN